MLRIKGAEPCRKNGGPGNNNGESHRLHWLRVCYTLAMNKISTGKRSRYPIYIPLYSHVRYMRDRPSLSRYRGMASRASLPKKRTSGSDGLDGEWKYKFNFEIKLRSVEEKETFKRRLSKVCGLLTPPGSSKPIDNLGLMYEFF